MSDSTTSSDSSPATTLHHSKILSVIGLILFVAAGLVQSYNMYRWKGKWMLAMTIGCFTYALGVATISSNLSAHFIFTTLSPCAFIAAEYVILGRLARHLQASQHLAIGAGKVAFVFVMSDVITFAMQGAGTGIEIVQVKNLIQLGHWVRLSRPIVMLIVPMVTLYLRQLLLGGLALQLVSFLFFTWMVIAFLRRMKRVAPEKISRDDRYAWYNDGNMLIWGLVLSCCAIIVRSVYRVVQFAIEGNNQSLGLLGGLSSDAYFYLLDALPMLVAVSVSAVLWPARFITPESMAQKLPEPVPIQPMRRKGGHPQAAVQPPYYPQRGGYPVRAGHHMA
ncbi:RTA1 like protein-domain-containing protein [Trametes polyzona]|nr:RTA1 like protein-domain-containing protein [Trametes polyzona]